MGECDSIGDACGAFLSVLGYCSEGDGCDCDCDCGDGCGEGCGDTCDVCNCDCCWCFSSFTDDRHGRKHRRREQEKREQRRREEEARVAAWRAVQEAEGHPVDTQPKDNGLIVPRLHPSAPTEPLIDHCVDTGDVTISQPSGDTPPLPPPSYEDATRGSTSV